MSGNGAREIHVRGVTSPWRRTIAVLGAAMFLAPPIAGLLNFATRLGFGWWPTSDGSTDLVGIAGTHVLMSYIFGSIPAFVSGLILSILVWRQKTISALVVSIVTTLSTLAYCLAIAVNFRGERVQIMSFDLVLSLTCLAVVTALIVRALLRWARFI